MIREALAEDLNLVLLADELRLLPGETEWVSFESNDGSMYVSFYPHTTFAMMDTEERRMTCCWHACMCIMEQEAMSNSSLRKRFGGDSPSASTISRFIHDAVDAQLIMLVDPDTAPRYMRYVPF